MLEARWPEVILAVLDEGALLGELSAVDGAPRSATVVALEPVEVEVTTHEEFNELLEEHPRLATELLRLVAARLRDASVRQLEFGTMDTLARLCATLVELANRYGQEQADLTEVTAPFHQGELAAWSGMSREAVVKGFRQLRSLGWLTIEGRTLTLHDVAAIQRRAHGIAATPPVVMPALWLRAPLRHRSRASRTARVSSGGARRSPARRRNAGRI